MQMTLNAERGDVTGIDWVLFLATLPLLGMGLLTMNSFTGDSAFFEKQVIWIAISLGIFFLFSFIDWRFLRRTDVLVWLFFLTCLALATLLVLGTHVKGAQSWFQLGVFSFQPAEVAKLVLILILSKYFSRRHIEIARIRHLLVSAVYTGILAALVFFQPDFGSAIIMGIVWLGMVFVSGISKRHLLVVGLAGVILFLGLWFFGFAGYQKERIISFLDPLADIQDSGYNAFQSMIAVGSGGVFGKGVGFGTQSRLKFLPEYETDFIFSAYAEEWGFIGVAALFLLYSTLIWRILANTLHGATNFETLFGFGLVFFFISHFAIHVWMNVGLLPVTGITFPFLSYGGTHLLTEFTGLGILMGMRRYRRAVPRELAQHEFVGP